MSETDTSRTMVRAFYGDRQREFQLRLGEISLLEQRCNAGIGEIMARLATHRFTVQDILAPVQLGLEGGGCSQTEVRILTERYQPPNYPIADFLALAVDIVQAAVSGVPEKKVETEGVNDPSPATSPSSSARASSPASRRRRSKN